MRMRVHCFAYRVVCYRPDCGCDCDCRLPLRLLLRLSVVDCGCQLSVAVRLSVAIAGRLPVETAGQGGACVLQRDRGRRLRGRVADLRAMGTGRRGRDQVLRA